METNPDEIVNKSTSSATPPPETTPENKTKKNKYFKLLIPLTIILFILGIIYLKNLNSRNNNFIVNNKSSSTPIPKSYRSVTPTPTPIQPPYVKPPLIDTSDISSWNTFHSVLENLSFKYPNDWKIIKNNNGPRESVILEGTNGFRLEFSSGPHYPDGGCDQCIVQNIVALNFTNHSPLYVTENQAAGTIIYLSDTKSEVGKNSLDWFITSKNQTSSYTAAYSFIGAFYGQDNNKFNGYSYDRRHLEDNAFRLQEFSVAKKILESISFN